jgi:NTE family protein
MGRAALVLSGGGVRGAYEAGVLLGVREVLGLKATGPAPFSIFAGTSSGAINAAFLAAHAHRGDLGVHMLADVWRSLSLHEHLRLNARSALPSFLRVGEPRGYTTRSLLDPAALHQTINAAIPWEQLHANTTSGALHALFVTALDASRGQTTMFAETHPSCQFVPSKDPKRRAVWGDIGLDHIMASAAIPVVFPAQRIDGAYFFDGGLRFNTPIAPALRAGAERLMVITVSRKKTPGEQPVVADEPGLIFLLGKLLNALLLDPVDYDLEVLERINDLMLVLDDTLDDAERARVDHVIQARRGVPYRALEHLVFQPSVDIGELAGAHLEENLPLWDLDRVPRLLLRRIAEAQRAAEADWAAFVLFDGSFAARLIDIGRQDALARADEIEALLGGGG